MNLILIGCINNKLFFDPFGTAHLATNLKAGMHF